MQTLRLVITLFTLWSVMTFFSPGAMAKITLKCIDTDGGLNLAQRGEVTVQALSNNQVLLTKIFQDQNWVSQKKYVEFYCNDANSLPKYRLIDCGAKEANTLPAEACPSESKGSIMLEAKHASVQPKSILAQTVGYQPYYTVSLMAPVEAVKLEEIRFDLNLFGLKKGANTTVKMVGDDPNIRIGKPLLGWKNGSNFDGVIVVRFDTPLLVEFGYPQTLNLWFEGLEETSEAKTDDNEVSITITNLRLEDDKRFYFESKPQVNRYSR